MDSILKLVMFSREHPDLELYKKFADAITIDAGNKYEKAVEESKINYLKLLCTKSTMTDQEVRDSYRFSKKYEFLEMAREYKKLAKRILRYGKKVLRIKMRSSY